MGLGVWMRTDIEINVRTHCRKLNNTCRSKHAGIVLRGTYRRTYLNHARRREGGASHTHTHTRTHGPVAAVGLWTSGREGACTSHTHTHAHMDPWHPWICGPLASLERHLQYFLAEAFSEHLFGIHLFGKLASKLQMADAADAPLLSYAIKVRRWTDNRIVMDPEAMEIVDMIDLHYIWVFLHKGYFTREALEEWSRDLDTGGCVRLECGEGGCTSMTVQFEQNDFPAFTIPACTWMINEQTHARYVNMLKERFPESEDTQRAKENKENKENKAKNRGKRESGHARPAKKYNHP